MHPPVLTLSLQPCVTPTPSSSQILWAGLAGGLTGKYSLFLGRRLGTGPGWHNLYACAGLLHLLLPVSHWPVPAALLRGLEHPS